MFLCEVMLHEHLFVDLETHLNSLLNDLLRKNFVTVKYCVPYQCNCVHYVSVTSCVYTTAIKHPAIFVRNTFYTMHTFVLTVAYVVFRRPCVVQFVKPVHCSLFLQ
jgi:hypothetical protein